MDIQKLFPLLVEKKSLLVLKANIRFNIKMKKFLEEFKEINL